MLRRKIRVRAGAHCAFVLLLLGAASPVWSQSDSLGLPVIVDVEEHVRGAGPQLALSLATTRSLPCMNIGIDHVLRRNGRSIEIELVGLTNPSLCATAFGPARANIPLELERGTYAIALTWQGRIDRYDLEVTDSSLTLRARGRPAFTRGVGSPFVRVRPHSFLLSCGVRNAALLCSDLGAWLEGRPGIARKPLTPDTRIGLDRHDDPRSTEHRLYEYSSDADFQMVRRCLNHIADVIRNSVGISITVHAANGELIRIYSIRSNHEPHEPVPQQLTGSDSCPDAS